MIYELLSVALFITNLITAILFYQFKLKIKQRPETLELQQFMLDLLQGSALVKVSRISPADIMLRSPRGS